MATHEHLSCREVVELVSDYLEGALPATTVARFEAHIAMCDGCDAYLHQMRATIDAMGQLREEAVPAETCAALLRAFREWKRGAHSPPPA